MRIRGIKKEFWDTLDLKEQIEVITVILISLVLMIGIFMGIYFAGDSSVHALGGSRLG